MIYLEPRNIYDQFIVGVAEGINVEEPCLIYSKNKILEYLMSTIGEELIIDHNQSCPNDVLEIHQRNMDIALEYFEYNIAGAYMGPSTPIFQSEFLEGQHD